VKVEPTKLEGVLLVRPKVFEDARGFFFESWNAKSFSDFGIHAEFVQDNHSFSEKGTLRGLHYQLPLSQGKLVRVTSGQVFDVVVDLRKDSPTFGQWEGFDINSRDRVALWIPRGFAHGFYVLSNFCYFQYKCDNYYDSHCEHTILWNDPDLQIRWPIPDGTQPKLSEKDRQGKPFQGAPCF
jgi:dTDP-4-dehydrorhamnose 3,5-epimerase